MCSFGMLRRAILQVKWVKGGHKKKYAHNKGAVSVQSAVLPHKRVRPMSFALSVVGTRQPDGAHVMQVERHVPCIPSRHETELVYKDGWGAYAWGSGGDPTKE